MASTINGTSTGNGGLISTGDDSGILNIQTNETTAITVDASQNVGIGTTSPTALTSNKALTINSPTGFGSLLDLKTNETLNLRVFSNASNSGLSVKTATPLLFDTNDTERMRIDSSGNLGIGTTTGLNSKVTLYSNCNALTAMEIRDTGTTGGYLIAFYNSGSNLAGGIIHNGTTTVNYSTSSDYRMKENIAPMTGALSKVALLNPVTYKWKEVFGGEDGQGFIAHELQAVIPDAVTGKKDAVDADGNPKYQGIDTSYLVATLTAAIQELKAINDTQAETINALTARIVALETV